MKTRYVFLITCWLTTTLFYAQQPASLTVLFNHDDHRLSALITQELELFVNSLDIKRIHTVSLSGHTDDNGSHGYNEALSQQRVTSVAKQLINLGLHERMIDHDAFGERMPTLANISEANMQANRRVELVVTFIEFSDLADFHENLSPGTVTTHLIDPQKDNMIQGDMGIGVQIPANALTDPEGRPIEGTVNFALAEALSNEQFLKEQLNTSSNGELLETGGMIKVTATLENGTELQLKDNAPIIVTIPTDFQKQGMQTFISEDGKDWTPQKQSSSPLTRIPTRPPFRFAVDKRNIPVFRPDIANKPRKPVDPVFPKAPTEPDALSYQRDVRWYQTLRKKQIVELAHATYLTAMTRYLRLSEKYDRKVQLYHHNCNSMSERLTDYNINIKRWREQQVADSLDQYNTWLAKVNNIDKQELLIQRRRYDKKLAAWQVRRDSILAKNKAILRNIKEADNKTLSYALSASQLGWINCDRFIRSSPADQFALDLVNPFSGKGRMVIVYEDIRSMIALRRHRINNQEGYRYGGLPKGRKAKLLAYYIEDGGLKLSVTSFSGPIKEIRPFEASSLAEFLDVLDTESKSARAF